MKVPRITESSLETELEIRCEHRSAYTLHTRGTNLCSVVDIGDDRHMVNR